MALELIDKFDELLKKYGVKMVGGWAVSSEHTLFEVYEAPSLEAFQKLAMEPEIVRWRAYHTTDIKIATDIKEATKMLKQAK